MPSCRDHAIRTIIKAAAVSALRLLVELVSGCSAAAGQLAKSAGSLFLYSNAKRCAGAVGVHRDVDVEGLCALVLGHCLISLGLEDTVAARESRGQLLRTVIKVVGLEEFTDRLTRLSKSKAFELGKKSKRALLREDNLFDAVRDGVYYEKAFVEGFEQAMPAIQKAVIEVYTDTNGGRNVVADDKEAEKAPQELEQEDMSLEALKARCEALAQEAWQYKTLIREQDQKIAELMMSSDRAEKPSLLSTIRASSLSNEEFLEVIAQTQYKVVAQGNPDPGRPDNGAAAVQAAPTEKQDVALQVALEDRQAQYVSVEKEDKTVDGSIAAGVGGREHLDKTIDLNLTLACKAVLNALVKEAAELTAPLEGSSAGSRSGLAGAVVYLIRLVERRDPSDYATLLELIDLGLDVCLCLEQLDEAAALGQLFERVLQASGITAGPDHKKWSDRVTFVKERLALQSPSSHDKENTCNGNRASVDEDEQAQLLLLLANQEAAKNLLLDTIRDLGGDQALIAAQAELGRMLASTL